VPYLAGHPHSAKQQPSARYHTTADTGADRYAYEVAALPPAPESPLAQSGHIAVVVQLYRQSETFPKDAAQRNIDPSAQVRGIKNNAGEWVERSGRANTHTHHLGAVHSGGNLVNKRLNLRDYRGRPTCGGGGDTAMHVDPPFAVDEGHLEHLGEALEETEMPRLRVSPDEAPAIDALTLRFFGEQRLADSDVYFHGLAATAAPAGATCAIFPSLTQANKIPLVTARLNGDPQWRFVGTINAFDVWLLKG